MIGTRARPPRPVPPGSAAIEVRGLTVARGARTVLDDVDLTVRTGEVLALVGPNGAGKSTLLAAISGDLAATGEIIVDGAPLASWSHTELAMRRAILLQKQVVSFPFTVAQIVAMGRAPWAGTSLEDEDKAAITEAMKQTDVLHLATRPYPRLSGGEQARTALSRVLAQRTATLLLDEPTAALDLHHQELVFDVLRERAAAGAAVVAVVHDLNLASAHADRVAMLSRGLLAACGPPDQILTAELVGEVYQHEIELVRHPRTGRPLIVPYRPEGVTHGPYQHQVQRSQTPDR